MRVVRFGSVGEAVAALEALDRCVEAFFDDPMTVAMGVPVGDFRRDFDARERGILSYIFRNAPEGSEEFVMAEGRLGKWLP